MSKNAKKTGPLPQSIDKSTRQEAIKVATMHPTWSFKYVDRGGKWPWTGFDEKTSHLILDKLGEFELMTSRHYNVNADR